MTILRPYWINRINNAWQKRSIIWLSGVRQVGKTTLARMLSPSAFLNCDLPSVQRQLADPEHFLNSRMAGETLIFDEVHRLESPSLLLKIASDEFPQLKILATGSSTLAATSRFQDTLTGRKYAIHLPPVLWSESRSTFNLPDLDQRLLRGGLPEALLGETIDPAMYSEWIDSFYARDIAELFAIRNRSGFLKLFRLLLRQSGRCIDFSSLANLSEMSRPTVKSHIEAMEIAHALTLVPPFHGGGRREITRMPKAYAFDTGGIAHAQGWTEIHESERGLLWEHLVLDELRSRMPEKRIHYWRDKSGREIDFVLLEKRHAATAIECKISPDRFDPRNLKIFRDSYPSGKNYLVSPHVTAPYQAVYDGLPVNVCSGAGLDKLDKLSLHAAPIGEVGD